MSLLYYQNPAFDHGGDVSSQRYFFKNFESAFFFAAWFGVVIELGNCRWKSVWFLKKLFKRDQLIWLMSLSVLLIPFLFTEVQKWCGMEGSHPVTMKEEAENWGPYWAWLRKLTGSLCSCEDIAEALQVLKVSG